MANPNPNNYKQMNLHLARAVVELERAYVWCNHPGNAEMIKQLMAEIEGMKEVKE